MADVKTAEDLAKEFREISIAEFFEKNRHLLGYENPTRALITIVKEGCDNALDACEDARILPEIYIKLKQLSEDKFKIIIEDNGPGIVPEKVTFAFGKLLYGTKFHKIRQTRGTMGLGISGALLYSQLTTGKPTRVETSTGKDIHIFDLVIDTVKNEPRIISQEKKKNEKKWHGIKIELEAEGRYIEKGQSILEYLKETAMSNPYAKIVFEGLNGKVTFNRIVEELPVKPKEIKLHPYGTELGILRRMLHYTKARNVSTFLTKDFSRVGKSSAHQICKLAKVNPNTKPQNLTHEQIDKLHKAMQQVKLIAPPTDCLSPLGEKLLEEGLKKQTESEFAVAISRQPNVYRGFPFQIEIALSFGGKLPTDQQAQLFRFANKVPLLYNQSDCVLTEATQQVDWRRYGFSQSSGQLPVGPLAILIHFASVWVPYTSEGKQAIAKYPEIIKEVKLALQDAGRELAKYVRHTERIRAQASRIGLFERYIPEVAKSIATLTGKDEKEIKTVLLNIVKKDGIREGEKNERANEET